ncbi:hypothetical protein TYRP_015693 [Tyrophagus putrescentiae]|nr:hypothetical protein TYRP_015693 [Tyrophagus putrescentiae]
MTRQLEKLELGTTNGQRDVLQLCELLLLLLLLLLLAILFGLVAKLCGKLRQKAAVGALQDGFLRKNGPFGVCGPGLAATPAPAQEEDDVRFRRAVEAVVQFAVARVKSGVPVGDDNGRRGERQRIGVRLQAELRRLVVGEHQIEGERALHLLADGELPGKVRLARVIVPRHLLLLSPDVEVVLTARQREAALGEGANVEHRLLQRHGHRLQAVLHRGQVLGALPLFIAAHRPDEALEGEHQRVVQAALDALEDGEHPLGADHFARFRGDVSFLLAALALLVPAPDEELALAVEGGGVPATGGDGHHVHAQVRGGSSSSSTSGDGVDGGGEGGQVDRFRLVEGGAVADGAADVGAKGVEVAPGGEQENVELPAGDVDDVFALQGEALLDAHRLVHRAQSALAQPQLAELVVAPGEDLAGFGERQDEAISGAELRQRLSRQLLDGRRRLHLQPNGGQAQAAAVVAAIGEDLVVGGGVHHAEQVPVAAVAVEDARRQHHLSGARLLLHLGESVYMWASGGRHVSNDSGSCHNQLPEMKVFQS